MQRTCVVCEAPFEVEDKDLTFLEEMSPTFAGKRFAIPPPTHCPDCREQRRAAQVNELHLYKRKCDLTDKSIISNFHPESPFKVYDQAEWYKDIWDPMEYGRDFDFNRPFFPQYQELCLAVPHLSLFTGYQYDENCDYTNYAGKNRNCYLIFDSDECWDCYYSYSINGSKNIVDCYRSRRSELCYEAIDCIRCYGCSFIQDCANCSDSAFLRDCIGCKHCTMCSNLRNKEYYVENTPVDPSQFHAALAALSTRSGVEAAQKRFQEFCLGFPRKEIHGFQNENVVGDYLVHSKNADHCFDSEDLWDCRYVFQGFMPIKDSMDLHECGEVERCYECSVCGYNGLYLLFSANCLDQLHTYLYTTYCQHSSDLFGCCGLRRKQYCVFNKQYTREEYERLVAKIIEHMQKTSEWGEHFPVTSSPFTYNESIAQEYFPLTKEETLERGYAWRDPDAREYLPQTYKVPDALRDVPDSITGETLACEKCGRNFKIIPQELAFYRSRALPVPKYCFLCRHRARLGRRNSWKLYFRTCAKCQKPIATTYSPDRPEIVVCEECYLASVE